MVNSCETESQKNTIHSPISQIFKIEVESIIFPNEETGITASSVCVYRDAYGQYQSQGKLKNGKEDGKWTRWLHVAQHSL